jgi:hypothetical protein
LQKSLDKLINLAVDRRQNALALVSLRRWAVNIAMIGARWMRASEDFFRDATIESTSAGSIRACGVSLTSTACMARRLRSPEDSDTRMIPCASAATPMPSVGEDESEEQPPTIKNATLSEGHAVAGTRSDLRLHEVFALNIF